MNPRPHTLFILAVCIFFALRSEWVSAQQQFSGRVYEGAVGVDTAPISGVAVSLYGSNNSGDTGTFIVSTTTNSIGWYGLTIRGSYEFYNIVESDPSGYSSVGATTVSGTVVNSNQIQYAYPIDGKTLTGNRFWDQKPQANNPPVADADGPYSCNVHEPVELKGSGSYDPDTGDYITTYQWGWIVSGTTQPIGGPQSSSNLYWVPPVAGQHTMVLTVTDTHGATDTDQATVTVQSAPSSQAGEIKGYKFNDSNGDGIWGPGELPLSGWTIFADEDPWNSQFNSGEPYAVTGSDGSYSLSGLAPGVYNVYEVSQTGWQITYPKAGFYGITIAANDLYDNRNFGNQKSESPYNYGFDYGDAPASYFNEYLQINTDVLMGKNVDGENSALSGPDAEGDDSNNLDDEDGVAFSSLLYPGQTTSVSVDLTNVKTNNFYINAKIDWNGNGQWEYQECVLYNKNGTPGQINVFSFTVPTDAKAGYIYARFTIIDTGPIPPNGCPYGEVEDYRVEIVQIGGGSSKWGQPPGMNPDSPHPECFWGWDQVSVHSVQIAADDWKSTDTRPVTDLHWWGSYLEWNGDTPPEFAPSSFQIGFWTDVPAGTTDPFGHPGVLIWESFVNRDGLNERKAGGDFHPDKMEKPETCFSYDLLLPQNSWFYPESQKTYWLSITAVYTQPPSKNPWGWKTRSSYFGATAVEITNPASAGVGSYFMAGAPLQFANDLAFILTTNQEEEKLDYGDARLPYSEASNKLGSIWFGDPSGAPDAEGFMMRNADALGDDNNGFDDENGLVLSSTPLRRGSLIKGCVQAFGTLKPTEGMSFGFWIDFNQDGDWDDAGDKIWAYYLHNIYAWPITITMNQNSWGGYIGVVPTPAQTGKTFARLRIENCDLASLSPNGSGGVGEVEDYAIEIQEGGTPLPPGGTVYGAKFNDLNGNGIWETAEPSLSDWQIWMDINGNGIQDAGDPVVKTDTNGRFLFTGLADGTYMIGEVLQPSWTQTLPGGMGTVAVIILNGQQQSPILFGNRDMRMPGEGQGALKWFQYPLQYPDVQGKLCFLGWSEPSMAGEMTTADNWFCFNSRPVTSIRWWGSYSGWDSIQPPPNAPIGFHIGVWTDEPVAKEGDWSHPKKMIREWYIERNMTGETAHGCHAMPEWKNNPDTCFRYTFHIPQQEWFLQEGDSAVYWVSIAAVYPEPQQEHIWGWLTRERYFNGDAVRIYAPAEAHTDSLYRIGERLPQYWDMAFVLGTDQNIDVLDFGDAPYSYGTSVSHNGAHHLIRPDIRMGGTIDMEDDGKPDPLVLGDDNNGYDDEDGVEFLTDLVPGRMALAAVTVTAGGFLNAWLDLDKNGEWDRRERIVDNAVMTAGSHILEYPVADGAVSGGSVMRFRFSTVPDVWVKGFAPDGEVEDYRVVIQKSTGVEENKTGTQPDPFRLYPNYPNPFNPSTTIRFNLPKAVHVRLSIYDLLGREIAVLVNGKRKEGVHEVRWNGLDAQHVPLPSGVYLYRLDAASYKGTGKLLLLK